MKTKLTKEEIERIRAKRDKVLKSNTIVKK